MSWKYVCTNIETAIKVYYKYRSQYICNTRRQKNRKVRLVIQYTKHAKENNISYTINSSHVEIK